MAEQLIHKRVALNQLRSRMARREEFPEWLPDPVASRDGPDDPQSNAETADAVGLALLVVLDALAPEERLAFVLHDMFGLPFDEIAPLVERTRPRPASSQAVPGGGSVVRHRTRGAGPTGARSPTRSWPRPGAATSPAWSGCCPRTSCCTSTPGRAVFEVHGAEQVAGQAAAYRADDQVRHYVLLFVRSARPLSADAINTLNLGRS